VLVKPGDKVQKEQPPSRSSRTRPRSMCLPCRGDRSEVSLKSRQGLAGTLIAKLDSAADGGPVEQVAPESPIARTEKKPETPVEEADPQTLYQTPPREHGGPTHGSAGAVDEAAFHQSARRACGAQAGAGPGGDLSRVKGAVRKGASCRRTCTPS